MSRFRSLISVAALASCAGSGGCDGDDESCGPEGAPASGIVAATTPTSIEFGNFTGGPNNDCPDTDGIVSLTIAGTASVGTGFLTLCVERPDRFGDALDLGFDDAGVPVHVVDVTASADNCSYRLDQTVPPTGTATSDGLCGNGADPAGFALVLDGTVSLQRTCGTTIDTVAVTLRGRVAVSGP
ncbi:MAG: hypothetical protein ABI867_14075 [Kofleriaceae bacterium]